MYEYVPYVTGPHGQFFYAVARFAVDSTDTTNVDDFNTILSTSRFDFVLLSAYVRMPHKHRIYH